tara:strand:+ start:231 stop:653 length:423 start_codon:yes stop_codon:yes gene_type:complete
MKITGQCHCGTIRLTGETDIANCIACHCTDCQVFSGGPYRAVAICKTEDVIFDGVPKEYVKIADSGNKKIQGFCGNCGTQLFATDENKTVFNIRVGWLDQRDLLKPRKHIFGTSSQDWIKYIKSDPWVLHGPNSQAFDPY